MKPGKREERTTSKRAPLDAARTQEIGAADILEDNPIEVDIPIDVEADVPEDDADSSSVSGRSISPLALSVAPPEPGPRTADATYKITAMRPRRRLGMVVVGVMGLSACILLGAAVRAGSGNDEAAQTAATSVSMSSGLPPVVAASPAPQAADPAPASGTIVSRGASLVIDGTKLTASSAMVACGHHMVRTGRAKAKDLVVPCGGTLTIDRWGKTTTR